MQTKINQNGNIAIIGVVGITLVIVVGIFAANSFKTNDTMIANTTQNTEDSLVKDQQDESSDVTMKNTQPSGADSGDKMEPSSVKSNSGYQTYSKEAFDAAKGKKRIYFFHATWCPTCKAANQDFTSRISDIPDTVVIFKTEYDTSIDLKKQYNITYQHTFVQVDENGNEIEKWNGGDLTELLARIN